MGDESRRPFVNQTSFSPSSAFSAIQPHHQSSSSLPAIFSLSSSSASLSSSLSYAPSAFRAYRFPFQPPPSAFSPHLSGSGLGGMYPPSPDVHTFNQMYFSPLGFPSFMSPSSHAPFLGPNFGLGLPSAPPAVWSVRSSIPRTAIAQLEPQPLPPPSPAAQLAAHRTPH